MSNPFPESVRILNAIMDFFLMHPLSQLSLNSLKPNFPNIDIHYFLTRLEEDNVLMRSKILIGSKPVTHWNLRGSASDYSATSKSIQYYKSIQNDIVPESLNYMDNFRNFSHSSPPDSSIYRNRNVFPNLDNTSVMSSQTKMTKPTEILKRNSSKPEIQASSTICFLSCSRRENDISAKRINKTFVENEGERMVESSIPNDKCKLAPRRLKELSSLREFTESIESQRLFNLYGESKTRLNPNTQEFIPLSVKNSQSINYLQKSDSLESSEVNNLSTELMTALTKNPVSVLNEFAQQRGMTCDIEVADIDGPSHKPKFSMHVNLNGRKFDTIIATNKKEGKRLAADTAIRKLISEGHFAERISRLSSRVLSNDGDIHEVEIMASKNSVSVIDNLASLVYNKLAKLLKTISPDDGITLAGRKVVSAIIMQDKKHDTFQVVSLATGNRCISGDKISLQGQVVNDCHAEVVTRRAFMLFIYRQLIGQITGSSVSLDIFDNTIPNKHRFQIKDHIKFHLYISTAPCGDGALFCNRENDHKKSESDIVLSKDHCPTFEHPVQGLLRSKIEGGEGTIPVNNVRQLFQIQSLDGILRGERLKTMSCSDKIARWNYLGIQGSLLSQIIEPIYIKSIALGNLYNAGHLCRALCCRLDRDKLGQKNDFEKVNHPDLGYVYVGSIQREIDKSNELSINWSYGLNLEVIDGITGQLIGIPSSQSACSRISKAKLFSQYIMLRKSIDHAHSDFDLTYGQAKLLSSDYEKQKQKLYEIFHKLEYGSWIRKPLEQNNFRNVIYFD